MDEMMEDVLEVEDDEELEAEADEEVDKVLFDITEGRLGQAGAARAELPVCVYDIAVRCYANLSLQAEELALNEETERAMEQHRAALNGLLS
jgi:charged multivesicular body protein 3